MSSIHPTAIIGKKVEIGVDNAIGPHVIIEDEVKIGAHNRIEAGAYICSGTEIGNYNEIHMHAVIGHTPQDLAYKGQKTFTQIGHHNKIREFATVHRGTKEGTATIIGDNNYLMAYTHVAHNCELGNRIIMVNQASLTGYCIVEDSAFLSGMTGFHQFTRIGKLALVSALSACNKDIPPFMICGGRPGVVLGVNVVGLRRAGMDSQTREEIRKAYKLLYRSGLNVTQAIEAIEKSLGGPEIKHLVGFIRNSKRGIVSASSIEESNEDETLNARKT